MARLFVAVQPPDVVLDAIAALARPAEPGVRYTTREQWHVTLRFLGDADVGAATVALESIDAPGADAELGPQASRLGRDVVVIPVAGLDKLAEAVTAATSGVGQPPEHRRFRGHLTVARLRHRGACRVAGAPFVARFAVDEVHLVRSHLDRHGARYERIATRRLGPPEQ